MRPSRRAYRSLPACKDRAAELGIPDMFVGRWSNARITVALENTRKSAEHYHKHGVYPQARDGYLGKWLDWMRRRKAGLTTRPWYPECEELAIELGCPDMFVLPGSLRKTKALENTRKIAEWYHEHGAYPPANGKGGYLGKWLSGMRTLKSGQRTRGTWYPECEELAIELGCPDMFDLPTNRYIENALAMTRQIAQFYKKMGRYPKYKEPGGQWHRKMCILRDRAIKGTKINDGYRGTWYPQCLELAIELGCPDMFDMPKEG